ncbi:MAG: hypothetical protein RID15_20435 [Marinovum algicola]|jgi:Tfp pilus assembly protein PilP|uniref:Type IV pilus biogenesis protein PilP n=1 Tax=Marinovum algicola TaxID=42444 RepID=A0A975WBK3_9RHOB|nr:MULTISPECIES: hypothetical protein [Marinovum]AKO97484.1 hypothetical protein MALG_02320 [Marinovum algicola DG 898]MDD9738573.1 hypothetical protein [Marinovum sp. SP66]MDD9744401.1 hypothetical protein [Marinovum sp. PR37]SEJ78283.1 hypothetical protein SAMN04487940_110119 [Marinovum algicola]SLN59513.1 hypothetical protein MAA5396_03128 [Marinovum algicola]
MAQTVKITPETRAAATQKAELPMTETVLLGTLTSQSGTKAILRNGFGGVSTVSVGEHINGGEVTAIRDGEVYISQDGRGIKLTIPGS